MLDLMEKQDADFVDVVHQLKDAFGAGTGGIPGSVTNLQGLASDVELQAEYTDPKTSPARKEQIIAMRHKAGRTGKLFDAQL